MAVSTSAAAPPKPKSIHDVGDINWLHMMLVAPSGFGKTVFLGKNGDLKVLLLLTDPEGSFSAKRFGSTIEEWTCPDANSLSEAVTWLQSGGYKHYDVIAVDNISAAQLHYRARAKEINRANGTKSDEFKPTQDEYLTAQIAIERLVKQLHDLPVHIVWTAWQEEHENMATGDVYYAPNIQGSKGALAQQILGYMNVTAFGEVVEEGGKEKREFTFTHKSPRLGKDRWGAFQATEKDLGLVDVVQRIEDIKKGRTAAPSKTPAKKRVAPRKAGATTTKPRRAVTTK